MARESYRRRASVFTCVLVVLGLIMLIVLAIPYCINRPSRVSYRRVKQNAQFHSIKAALDLFENEFNVYPPSDANDSTGKPYCGAMKLAEAMMGRDMLGFHSESVFRADGATYAVEIQEIYNTAYAALTARRGPYLPPERADALEIQEIYTTAQGSFLPESRVLCDVYKRKLDSGKKVGLPILYYKADTSKTAHDVNDPNNPNNIYNYRDNHALLALGVPGDPEKEHPLFTDPKLFYKMTKSDKVTTASQPFKADTYILISAGKDGLYGTPDDICNFDYKFPE